MTKINFVEGAKSFAEHFLIKSSILCKTLYGIAIAGFLLQLVFGDGVVDVLCISVQSLGTHVWTLATFWLVETNALVLLADLLCIHLAGTVLEPVWKTAELVKYVVLVNLVVALSATLLLFIAYITGLATEQSFFEMPVHGLSGVNGAVLVGVKQMLPDAVVLSTSYGRLKNNHIPSLLFCVCVLLVLLRAIKWIVPAMYIAGVYYGWVYLRYYQKHDNGAKGDPAEHFALVTFLPSAVHPYAAPLFNGIYRLLVRLGILRPHIRRFVDVNQMTSGVNMQPLAGADTQEAERRRQIALRELSERLARTRKECDGDIERSSWPVLDEPEAGAGAKPSPAPQPSSSHGHSHDGQHSHGHSHGGPVQSQQPGSSPDPQMSPLPVDVVVAAATVPQLGGTPGKRPSDLLSTDDQTLNFDNDNTAQLVLSPQSPVASD